ncbi:MAG TPA: Arc family DNA-binding protein [Gammaproteobacteria bacterium]|nr:Arc family DNA-binding protein [Gammaproteobacteria bacterium]
MPNLSIKNVSEAMLEELRARAARHHRSLQGELMALLTAALAEPTASVTASPSSEQPAMRRSGTRRIEDIAAEHRRRLKRPVTRGPLAVDIVRADRDAR